MLAFVDPALQERFDREGYVTAPLLNAEQLVWLREQMEGVLQGRPFVSNDPDGGSNYVAIFDADPQVQANVRADVMAVVEPLFASIIRGAEAMESSIIVKPPQGCATMLHQHPPHTEHPFGIEIFCWCPLYDCDALSGALRVIPRTHHFYRFIKTFDAPEFFSKYRDTLTNRYAVPVAVKAGEAIFFENTIIHGAAPNLSDRARVVISTLLVPKGSVQAVYRAHANGIDLLDAASQGFQVATLGEQGLARHRSRVIRTLPRWKRHATLQQFEALLRSGRHASERFDPLEAIAGREQPAVRRVPLARRLARRLPERIKRRLRPYF